jgi:hypothetical protein
MVNNTVTADNFCIALGNFYRGFAPINSFELHNHLLDGFYHLFFSEEEVRGGEDVAGTLHMWLLLPYSRKGLCPQQPAQWTKDRNGSSRGGPLATRSRSCGRGSGGKANLDQSSWMLPTSFLL